MISLFEKYRPSQWSDVVGQDKAISKIDGLRKRGLSGRAFWITGASGTGKTTIARLIASEIASELAIEEIDAQGLTANDVINLERGSWVRGMGSKSGRVIIINEAHGLRNATIRQLLVTLERICPHAVWIFTTTTEGQESLFDDCPDASPLLSRCVTLSLSRQGLAKPFAERARMIAQSEGLDGKPIERYVRLVQDAKNNFRAVLQAIDAGEMVEA